MTLPAVEQLLNLANRAERGPLTPDEAQRLRDGLNELLLNVRMQNGLYRSAEGDVAGLHTRAERAEGAIERVRKVADELIATGATWDGNEPDAGRAILAVLDPQEPQP